MKIRYYFFVLSWYLSSNVANSTILDANNQAHFNSTNISELNDFRNQSSTYHAPSNNYAVFSKKIDVIDDEKYRNDGKSIFKYGVASTFLSKLSRALNGNGSVPKNILPVEDYTKTKDGRFTSSSQFFSFIVKKKYNFFSSSQPRMFQLLHLEQIKSLGVRPFSSFEPVTISKHDTTQLELKQVLSSVASLFLLSQAKSDSQGVSHDESQDLQYPVHYQKIDKQPRKTESTSKKDSPDSISALEKQSLNVTDLVLGIFDQQVPEKFKQTVFFAPSVSPSNIPTSYPSNKPSSLPTLNPSSLPSTFPSISPTSIPSLEPSMIPSAYPSSAPSFRPSQMPTLLPSFIPSSEPTTIPSLFPSLEPTHEPSLIPSSLPTSLPSIEPSTYPSSFPTLSPSLRPSITPSSRPSSLPSLYPTTIPSLNPSAFPSNTPSVTPTLLPSSTPSLPPTLIPSLMPTSTPSFTSSTSPTLLPTSTPSLHPTSIPSLMPTSIPSHKPSRIQTLLPTATPSYEQSATPSFFPTLVPSSLQPSNLPSLKPTKNSKTMEFVGNEIPRIIGKDESSDKQSTRANKVMISLLTSISLLGVIAFLCFTDFEKNEEEIETPNSSRLVTVVMNDIRPKKKNRDKNTAILVIPS